MRQVRLFTLAAVLIGAGEAQPTFLRQDVPAPGSFLEYGSFTVGDFNGDGRPDLATVSPAGIAVMLNQGTRPGQSGVRFSEPVLTEFKAIGSGVAADFNRDGKLDLIGLTWATPGGSALAPSMHAMLLLGRGDGTFLPPRDIGPAAAAWTADLNEDGVPDLVLGTLESSAETILLGNGDGSFHAGSAIPMQGLPALVGDFNRDGHTDFARLIFGSTNSVAVWLGRGDGGFREPVLTPLDHANNLMALDFNGDGVPDLATSAGILLGKGDGSFGPARPYAGVPADYSPCATADFDGDKKADVVLCYAHVNPATNEVWVVMGTDSGVPQTAARQTVGWQAFAVATADFDGDGKPDMATLNGYSRTASVLLNGVRGVTLPRAVSAASGTALVAPGSLATLYVATGATGSEDGVAPWPVRLGGLSLMAGSGPAAVAAPLVYVSPTQINFQVPNVAPGQEVQLSIVRGNESVLAGTMQVEARAPALFMADQAWLTPVLTTADQAPSVLNFYGTGFGNASVSKVECTIRGLRALVEFAGAEGTPGVERLQIRMPAEIAALVEDESIAYAEVLVSLDGVPANAAVLVFRYRVSAR